MAAGHHRGRAAGLHARPHAQRRVHHPRRGAEHLARADEDVPHPARLRLQDRRHRRRHPGRPARRHRQRPAGRRRSILDGVEDVHFCRLHRPRTSSGTGWSAEIVDGVRRSATPRSRPTTPGDAPAAPAAADGDRDEHRGPQRVRAPSVDDRALVALSPLRARPDAGPPAGRAVHHGGRRGHHGRAATCSGWTSQGPTDVLAFPMDELRPGREGDEEPEEGVLGDLVLCPSVAAQQAADGRPRAPTTSSLLLTTHGILHLLGYDHAEPEEERGDVRAAAPAAAHLPRRRAAARRPDRRTMP